MHTSQNLSNMASQDLQKEDIVWDEHLFQPLLNRAREIEHQGFDPQLHLSEQNSASLLSGQVFYGYKVVPQAPPFSKLIYKTELSLIIKPIRSIQPIFECLASSPRGKEAGYAFYCCLLIMKQTCLMKCRTSKVNMFTQCTISIRFYCSYSWLCCVLISSPH